MKWLWPAIQGIGIVAAILGGSPAAAQVLSHTMPASLTPGQTTTVTIHGTGLANAQTLWTTFPAEVVRAPGTTNTDNQAVFHVTVPPGTPIGPGGIRVVTDAGISDPRPFVVDDLPISICAETNTSLDTAQPLALPMAVDGILQPETSDFFAITVKAGQRVAFETFGHRYGFGFDPLVRLWSPERREIISYDNDEGLGFDNRFEHVFEKEGVYFVEITDTRYQGGGNWTYHLRMGDFPIARVAFPPSGTRGHWVNIAFPGRHATDVVPMSTQVPMDPLKTMVEVAAKGGDSSTWVRFIAEDSEQQIELEPNDEPAAANAFAAGRTLNGRLQVTGDVDCYRFQAAKGQPIEFAADSYRLASPADLYLRVLNAAGGEVVVADDAGAEEAKFTFTAPEDGWYTLVVEDLHRRGGPEFTYRITSRPSPADFSLAASTDRLVIPRGSSVPFVIQAGRAGYNDPIEIDASLTGTGCAPRPTVVPAGAGSEPTVLTAAIDAPLGLQTLRISGTGKIGDRALVRGINLTGLVAPKLDNLQLLPSGLVTEIPVYITPPAFFEVAAQVDAPAVARFAKTPMTVRLSKQKFFDEEVALEISNLPPNVAVAAKPIAKGAREVQLEIESKKDSPLGKFPVFVAGVATERGRSARVFADILTFSIEPAFSIAMTAPESKIAKGGKLSVEVKATRHPSYQGPIEVELKNLPAGVTAPKGTIAEKQDSVTIELAAAGDAAAATIENLTAVATANPGAAVETVNSPAAKLTVE